MFPERTFGWFVAAWSYLKEHPHAAFEKVTMSVTPGNDEHCEEVRLLRGVTSWTRFTGSLETENKGCFVWPRFCGFLRFVTKERKGKRSDVRTLFPWRETRERKNYEYQ